jgi:hypothetical protein
VEKAAGRIDDIPDTTRSGRFWDWFGKRGLLTPRPMMATLAVVFVLAAVFVLSRYEHSRFEISPRTEPVQEHDPYSDADLEQAKQDVVLAFAYVEKFSRKTGHIVREDVFGERIVTPVLKAVVTARDAASKQE